MFVRCWFCVARELPPRYVFFFTLRGGVNRQHGLLPARGLLI